MIEEVAYVRPSGTCPKFTIVGKENLVVISA